MRAGVGWLAILVALVACSQRVTPEDEYARQERERPLLSPAEAPRALTTGAAGTDAPPTDQAIRGVIEGPADPDAAVSSTDVVFLYVRPAGATGGPPLAVRRLPAASFPIDFAIGPADAMLPGTTFPERVTVEARLDRDGDPLTVGPEDWTARSGPVAPGTAELTLRLSPGTL